MAPTGAGRNLDALNDILFGEFGPLPDRFTVVWHNAADSRVSLNHARFADSLRIILLSCHPSNAPAIATELQDAERGEGPTLFDYLVGIIEEHENVKLILAQGDCPFQMEHPPRGGTRRRRTAAVRTSSRLARCASACLPASS